MVKKLISYYKKHIGLLIIDLSCTLVFALIDIIYPFITKEIINGRVSTKERLIVLCLALLFIYAFRYLCAYIVSYIGHILGVSIETDMRSDLFKKFEQMDYSYFDDKKSGELVANLTTNLFDISEAAHHTIEDVISSFFIIVGSFSICMYVNYKLTLIVFSGILVLMIFTILRRKKMMRTFRVIRKEQADITSQIASSISGIQLTKAFNNETFEVNNFNDINNNLKKARVRQIKEFSFFHSTTNFIVNVTNLLMLLVGGIMFINIGEEFLADLVMFFLYVNFLISPITKLSSTIESTQQAWSGYEKFYNIMMIQNKITSKDNAIIAKDIQGKIEFKNVYFKYHDETEDVLNNFNLTISPGKKIAIIGETGVGKSTISKIIPRFYDINKGEILIDNINVKDYDLLSLRETIGHIQQDIFIFYGSIADNIRYGKPNASFEEIKDAAKKANIADFIESLPNKYDTVCGERGIQLSGGQKQRIAIARIFLKHPAILILDEATSALDNITEKQIQASFDELAKDRTTIIIAHRLSTIKDADNIIVLGKKGIIEQGTHQELLNLEGYYYKMYNAINKEN